MWAMFILGVIVGAAVGMSVLLLIVKRMFGKKSW